MGAIAVLGWGSLIWDRGGLPVDLPDEHEWYENGPVVPIEFVRQSQEGHLTLVIWEGGTHTKVRWAPLKEENLQDAVLALRKREGRPPPGKIRTAHVGVWSRGVGGGVRESIKQWADVMPFDHVIWTDLPPKWNGESGVPPPSCDDAVAHLKKLISEGKAAKAEEYVRRAPSWVRTQFRDAFEDQLGWAADPERSGTDRQ